MCRSNARYAKDDDISLDRACGRTSIVEGIFQAPTWCTCRHPPRFFDGSEHTCANIRIVRLAGMHISEKL